MIAWVLLAVYLAVVVVMGVWGMRRTSTIGDFFLGNRSIGPWVSALAYGTTYFSAVIFIGFAGKLGWKFGMNVVWIAIGNALFGALAAWLVLGRRTRRMTQNLGAMTMPEYLEQRYGGKLIKILGALVIFIFLLPYSASIFKGLSHLFEAVFHLPYDWALVIMIGITGLYLILGGYFAITITDFFQGLIMIVGAALMIGIVLGKAGGIPEAFANAATAYRAHVPSSAHPSFMYVATLVSLVFMTSFGTWGLPQMVQKFYAVKNEKVIVRAAIVTFVFSIVIAGAAYLNGAFTHVFVAAPPALPDGGPDWDRLVPDILTATLPGWLMAIILLLVLSASMSTLSSLVLVSASAIAIDLYAGGKKERKGSLALIRVLSGVFVIVSFVIARYQLAVIVTLMSLSWGVVAGAFMAPFLYGLYWKKATRAGALAGMLTGAILGIVLFFALGPDNSPISASIAMIVPFGVVPLVSAFTTRPSDALVAKAFDGVTRA
ncbi:MAG TPA: sodium/solute symporter [Spirochaetia bacterium]